MKIKTGIMGGTFNPIHNAHITVAGLAQKQLGLDSVWFMTSGNPPHKKNESIVDARVREDMVRLAIENEPCFELCSYETERSEYSYTANTLTELTKMYPEREFYFIIGADSLEKMVTWYRPEVIAAHCKIIVFGRGGACDLPSLAAERAARFNTEIFVIDAPLLDISSSEIRRRIKNGESTDGMLLPSVREYIKEHGLYISE